MRNGFDKPPLGRACWSTAHRVQVAVPSSLCCHPCELCGAGGHPSGVASDVCSLWEEAGAATGHNHVPPFVLGQACVVPKNH